MRLVAALEQLPEFEMLEIPAGEEQKSWEVAGQLLTALAELGADRRALLIALGGGVVTDLGGFVASIYKRGIDHVLVPTSLLGMTDAAIGGKNGVDLDGAKNLAGVFAIQGHWWCGRISWIRCLKNSFGMAGRKVSSTG